MMPRERAYSHAAAAAYQPISAARQNDLRVEGRRTQSRTAVTLEQGAAIAILRWP